MNKIIQVMFYMATFCTLAAGQAFAQGTGQFVWKEKTEGEYTYKYVENDPTEARFYTLNNGLTVILSPSKKQPRIQAYITTKAGSKIDPQDHTGVAHYLEHLLFKGTDKVGTADWAKEKPLLDQIYALYEEYNHTTDEAKRTEIYKEIDRVSGEAAKYAIANEYDKIMSSIGATGTNAFTSFDQTAYTEDIPSNAVDQFLAVQADRFQNPIFRLFHTELETVYEEKNMSLDRDNSKVMDAMFEALLPNHNYGKQTILGSVDHLKNPSLKAIQKYFDAYYVPNNMAVVMSGDFDPAVMVAKVDKAFAYMAPKNIEPYTFEQEKNITQPIIREVSGPNPEFLLLAFRFPGAGTKEAKMLNLIGNMLNNDAAGLIDLNIVKSQKMLGAYAFPYVLNDYSILVLQGNPLQGQSLDQAKDLLLAELKKLQQGDFSDDLIQSIVNNERKSEISRREGYKGRASDLMSVFIAEGDWAEELSYADWLASITKEDVVEFANRHFNDHNYVAVYKRQGQDTNTVKVVKPAITPIEVNRTDKSAFFARIEQMPEEAIEPMWVDYDTSVDREKLDGLDLYAVKNENNELFSFTYHFKTGKWNNKLLGLAAGYIEFLGTKDKTSEDLSRAFYSLASSFNVSSGNEETTISVSGLHSNFVSSVALVQELINDCVADSDAFEAYIGRLKKSRANAKENKDAIAQGLMAYAKYGANNPFNYTLTDAELEQIKAEDLVKAIHDLANTEHSVLYYGPASAKEVSKNIKPLKRNKATYLKPAQGTLFTELVTDQNKVLFANFPMKQVDISWVRNTGIYNSDNAPVVALFNSYFGGGMGSVVFQTIRESKALAYTTYAVFAQPTKASEQNTIRAYIGTQADKFNEAIEGMNDLLNVLPESNIALTAAKTNLLKSLASQRITDAAILNSFVAAQRLGNSTDIRKDVYEKASKMTYADLNDFHKKEFSTKPYVYCVVGEKTSLNQEDMQKLGEVKTLSLEEIFGY